LLETELFPLLPQGDPGPRGMNGPTGAAGLEVLMPRDLVEPGALKGFPSASPFPIQTKAQRIYCPLTAQARWLRGEEGLLMPHILAHSQEVLTCSHPKNQTVLVWHPGMPCGRPAPAIASHPLPAGSLGMCLGQLNMVRGRGCLKYLRRA